MNRSLGYKKAFTLVEIVFVLVVYAIIAIFIPLSAKRMEKAKTTFSSHNSFECYWAADKEDDYKVKLWQKYSGKNNGEPELATKEDDFDGDGKKEFACTFIMPRNVSYAEMIAVGGGGAGGDFTGDVPVDENYYALMELRYKDINTLPEYMRYILNSATRNELMMDDSDPKLWIGEFVRRQKLLYSVSGNAGELVSYFFSRNKGGEVLYIVPGRGGIANCPKTYNNKELCKTNDGTDTIVYKLGKDDHGNDKYNEILKAQGGKKGELASYYDRGTMVQRKNYSFSNPLLGKQLDDRALEKSSSVLSQSSDYKTQAKSDVAPEYEYGASGFGAYTFPNDTSGYFAVAKNTYRCNGLKVDEQCAMDNFTPDGWTDLTQYMLSPSKRTKNAKSLYFKQLNDNCEFRTASDNFTIFRNASYNCYKPDMYGNYSYWHSPEYADTFRDKSKIKKISYFECSAGSEECEKMTCKDGSTAFDISNGSKIHLCKCNPASGKDGAFSIVW